MRKLAITTLLVFTFNLSFTQRKKVETKEIPIDTIVAILNPSNGKVDNFDLSYSYKLNEKYGIKSFEFYKINALDGSDCNFVYFNGEDYFPVSLDIGDTYLDNIYNEDKTVYARVKYNKYFRNEKNPIASTVEVIFYVYKVKNNKNQ